MVQVAAKLKVKTEPKPPLVPDPNSSSNKPSRQLLPELKLLKELAKVNNNLLLKPMVTVSPLLPPMFLNQLPDLTPSLKQGPSSLAR